MKNSNKLLLLSALLALTMTACAGRTPKESKSSSEPASTQSSAESSETASSTEPVSSSVSESESSIASSTIPSSAPAPVYNDTVSVFVLSGQSNMEGSTYWIHPNGTPLLENYMDEEGLDTDGVLNGIDSVLTSYYGFYYPNKWGQAHSSSLDQSSAEGKMQPNFQPTKVGMGVGDTVQGKKDIFFGPELGLANTIADYADENNPVHLIKCAFSGSGFTKADGPNWTNRDENPDKSLFYLLKTYTYSCLEAIEDEGYTPVLKGFLWHQGESDGGDSNYETYTRTLVGDFREEFADYAPDGDGENIAFIDCTIYDGKGTSKMSYGTAANQAKMKIGNESEDDLNFCIDASHDEGGLGLEIGDDSKGGFNTYHYNTPDAYILGKAYADIIIDNDLLDQS